jgi:hypothetical protein
LKNWIFAIIAPAVSATVTTPAATRQPNAWNVPPVIPKS